MIRHLQVSLHELVKCLSDAVDLVSPVVSNHHRQVGYIAYALGEQAGFRPEECSEMYLAGSLHDIGALSFQERLEALDFEVREAHRHARLPFNAWLPSVVRCCRNGKASPPALGRAGRSEIFFR